MNKNMLKRAKKKLELYGLKKKITKLSSSEKENLNKIINYATWWWLSFVDMDKTNSNDSFYKNKKYIDYNRLEKISTFKEELGIEILKRLLGSNEKIELYSDSFTNGILYMCMQNSNCSFLEYYFPQRAKMLITKKQIWVSIGLKSNLCLSYDVSLDKNNNISSFCDYMKLVNKRY